ncbi:MAG: hypothetical protein NZ750_05305 [Anaerolineae bacterium]|nr:hypothetical protein [Anaerolineae bacterium]MDW8172705.1 hypothetical protein [Anaerolineae bacterium]
MSSEAPLIIIDIGGTKTAAAHANGEGRLLDRRQAVTSKHDGEAIVQAACELLVGLHQAHP